jgi:hypothetical protein
MEHTEASDSSPEEKMFSNSNQNARRFERGGGREMLNAEVCGERLGADGEMLKFWGVGVSAGVAKQQSKNVTGNTGNTGNILASKPETGNKPIL